MAAPKAPLGKKAVSNKIAAGKKSPVKRTPTKKVSPIKSQVIRNGDYSNINVNPVWQDFELLSEKNQIDHDVARNLIKLWEEGNTIPFIAR